MIYPFKIGNFDVLGGGGGSEDYVTREEARNMINESLNTAKEDGTFDDTKVYETYEDMISAEPVGRQDTLYILTTDDEVHGTRYIWNGSEYTSIEDSLTSSDIQNIVV